MTTDTLPLADLAQLRLLHWSRPGAATVPAEEAFAVYEANWRFVDVDRLTALERRVIEGLAERFGAGLLNV